MKNVISKSLRDHFLNFDFNYNYSDEFEKNFAKFFNTKYCIGINSGINVLKTALEALKIKKSDEILVQGNISIDDIDFLIQLGYQFKCLDIISDTLVLDISKIKENITEKTKAIIIVHIYGICPNMDELIKIAREYNLFVIEDATYTNGINYKKKKLGSIGDIGCFSFNTTRNLSTSGDCGAIITNCRNIYLKLLMSKKSNNFSKYLPKNNINNFKAFILNYNLQSLGEKNSKILYIKNKYKLHLSNQSFITIPDKICVLPSNIFLIKLKSKKMRDNLYKYLKAYNIDVKKYGNFEKLIENWNSKQIQYKDKFIRIQTIMETLLYLPIHLNLNNNAIVFIVKKINKYFQRSNLNRNYYEQIVNDLTSDITKIHKFEPAEKSHFEAWFRDDRTSDENREKARVLVKKKRILFKL